MPFTSGGLPLLNLSKNYFVSIKSKSDHKLTINWQTCRGFKTKAHWTGCLFVEAKSGFFSMHPWEWNIFCKGHDSLQSWSWRGCWTVPWTRAFLACQPQKRKRNGASWVSSSDLKTLPTLKLSFLFWCPAAMVLKSACEKRLSMQRAKQNDLNCAFNKTFLPLFKLKHFPALGSG